MIYEYALEPEMVATWGSDQNSRFFIREFEFGKGRLVSLYPDSWMKRVWMSFKGIDDMDKKRLEVLLMRLKETMVKRTDCLWDDSMKSWLENALAENGRYPFRAILARNNPTNLPQVICENDLNTSSCPNWDSPHGIIVNRKAPDMAAAIKEMLSRCRWVKFVDPYISRRTWGHKQSLSAFLNILSSERPVGPLKKIEIHTDAKGPTSELLKEFYEEIIPAGLKVTLFQWKEKLGGQRLHNRYILTDLGGVSFLHGLDAGDDNEVDDVTRLDREQYGLHCNQYDHTTTVFDEAYPPLEISAKLKE